MQAAYAALFEALLDHTVAHSDAAELSAARAAHAAMSGETFVEDRTYEVRTHAFLDWMVFDRPLDRRQLTPARHFAESRATAPERADARGFCRTIHGLFEVRATGETPRLRNHLTGADYRLGRAEAHASLRSGELFEGRLVPWHGALHLSPACLFHPAELRRRILRAVRNSTGEPVQELLWTLARMAARAEHYRNVPLESLYDFDRPPPKATQGPMRFDAASIAERRARLDSAAS